MPSRAILIRADASAEIGAGHVMRCLALAKAWQSTGGSATYLMAECFPAIEERLVREGVTVSRITAAPATPADAQQTAAEATRVNASWLVVDGYRFAPDYLRRLKAAGLRILFLDDDGRFDFYPADVVLNQNISADRKMYEKRDRLTRLLLGPEYVLLRPEFLAETKAREHPAIARKVLVTMGGSDPDNVTGKVLAALTSLGSDIEGRVVVGSGNPWHADLQALTERLVPKVKLARSPENMAPLMRWADVAISGAGSTYWELAHMGLPAIVIAYSADQEDIAKILAERENAISLGWHANLSEEQVSDALLRLLNDYERRCAMSERGRKLVDGQGAARVVKFLQTQYETR